MRMNRLISAAAICLLALVPFTAYADDWSSEVETDLGFGSIDESGNIYRFRQYVTPAEGVYLDELRLRTEAPQNLIVLAGETLTEADKTVEAQIFGVTSPFTSLRWRYGDFEFHPDFDPNTASRITHRLDFRIGGKPGHPVFELGLRDQQLKKDDALDYPEFGSTDGTLGIPFRLGTAEMRASGTYGRFTDLRNDQPDFQYRGFGINGSLPVGERLLLGADLSRLNAAPDAPGRDGTFTGILADASYLASPALSFRGIYRLYDRDTPFTENGYSERISTMGLEATYRPFTLATLRIGAESRRIDHLNFYHTRVDTPQTDIYWIRLRLRPTRTLEARARYNNRRLYDQPGIGLYPRDSILSEVVVSYTPLANAGLTFNYNKDKRLNPFLDVNHSLAQTILGAWWVPSERLTISADHTLQNWSTNSTVLTDWLTDARITGMNASYVLNPLTSLDAGFYRYTTDGTAVSGRESDVFFGLHHRIGRLTSALIGYERVNYRDRINSINSFKANRVRLGLSTRL